MSTVTRINILTPVYNDWESLNMLIAKIKTSVAPEILQHIKFTVVNDGSSLSYLEPVKGIEIVHLARNLGHQRAIAIGLSHLSNNKEIDAIIVMDSDGEDKPEHIMKLIEAFDKEKSTIIFARRTIRHEGLVFQTFYKTYKSVFRILTGHVVNFGNYCIIPFSQVKKLAHVSEIWNNFPGGIIRSRLAYSSIPLERGTRLAGSSRMNFTSLIIHGLSAIAVHIDTAAIRLMMFIFGLVAIALAGILVISGIKIFDTMAVPGWATYTVIAFSIIIMQALITSILLAFMVLAQRTQINFIPAIDYKNYILEIEEVG